MFTKCFKNICFLRSFQFFRVISYIKNGWENNWIDKWSHLTTTSQDVNSEPSSTSQHYEFPGSAAWVPLIQAKTDFPSFSIQDIVTYFIERKANDKEANKDYKNVTNKAYSDNSNTDMYQKSNSPKMLVKPM